MTIGLPVSAAHTAPAMAFMIFFLQPMPSPYQDRDGFTAVHWAAMEDEALTMQSAQFLNPGSTEMRDN